MRYADLIAGILPNGSAVYATIVTYPFTAYGEVLPDDQQPKILARVSSFENPISSSAFTIAQPSLTDDKKADLLVRFLGAMLAAKMYLNNASHQECTTKAIETQLNVTYDTAALEYAAATNLTTGEVSPGMNLTVNQAGLENIIAVREEFGGFSVPSGFDFAAATTPGSGKLIDYSIRDKAILTLREELLCVEC